MSTNPSDDQILRAMSARPRGIMTYVIRNILAREHGMHGLKTSAVLNRLKRMERQGRVRRVTSGYATMLCWAVEIETPHFEGMETWSKDRLTQLAMCQGRRQQHGEAQCVEKDGSCALCVDEAASIARFYPVESCA